MRYFHPWKAVRGHRNPVMISNGLARDLNLIADVFDPRCIPGGFARQIAMPPVGHRAGQCHYPVVDTDENMLVLRIVASPQRGLDVSLMSSTACRIGNDNRVGEPLDALHVAHRVLGNPPLESPVNRA